MILPLAIVLCGAILAGLTIIKVGPAVVHRLQRSEGPKLLGPSASEVEDLKKRLSQMEDIVLFDGDKQEYMQAIKAAEERGRDKAKVEIARMRLAEKRLEVRSEMNSIELRVDNELPWPWDT